jgi:hypothetical protein
MSKANDTENKGEQHELQEDRPGQEGSQGRTGAPQARAEEGRSQASTDRP